MSRATVAVTAAGLAVARNGVGAAQETPDSHSVILLISDGGPTSKTCVATAVAAEFLVTAAHCVVGARPDELTLIGPGGIESKVETFTVHPDFDISDGTADLAILVPRTQLGTAALPIASVRSLATYSFSLRDPNGLNRRVSADGSAPARRVDWEPLTLCDGRPSAVCVAPHEGVGICVGDSGTPLLAEDRSGTVIFGVLSHNPRPDTEACTVESSVFTQACLLQDILRQPSTACQTTD